MRLTTILQGNLITLNLGFQPLISGGGSTSSYRVNYNKSEYEKLLETPLTFEITSAGNIGFSFSYDYSEYISGFTIEYKKNGGEWTEANVTTDIYSISVLSGDTVQFRGNNSTYGVNYDDDIYFAFSPTDCNFKLKGNIMSLLNKDNFASLDTLQSAYTFVALFAGCTGLTDASKLVLPATTLAEGCYYYMFRRCTSLITAPELPSTTLAYYCYSGMFGYTNIASVPSNYLPATTLAEGCYENMFVGCTSLTTAPELPSITLAEWCYISMFQDCTSLTTAPELPATTLADGCYYSMFYGCTSLTTAPELPATTLASQCYYQMFSECTGLTSTPELPATTLADSCYYGMFYGCTGLTTAPELPATTLVSNCYYYMFQNCSSLNYIKAMFTTTPGSSYTNNWVDGVASTGTFVKNSAATWNVTGGNGVPTGWTVQTA